MSELTPTVEDYLGLVYLLQREGRVIIAARLAERLNVSRPTVAVTLHRMERAGLIELNERKEISLTPLGREAAEDVIRRHMLTERLLHEVLGLPWHQVHAEADRLEHHLSPASVERLDSLLEQPATCPHGNPLPGVTPAAAVPLEEVAEGEAVVITRIVEEAEERGELLAFLEENGLLPGTRLLVTSCRPYNQTVTVEVDRGEESGSRPVVLGLATARLIRVRREG